MKIAHKMNISVLWLSLKMVHTYAASRVLFNGNNIGDDDDDGGGKLCERFQFKVNQSNRAFVRFTENVLSFDETFVLCSNKKVTFSSILDSSLVEDSRMNQHD